MELDSARKVGLIQIKCQDAEKALSGVRWGAGVGANESSAAARWSTCVIGSRKRDLPPKCTTHRAFEAGGLWRT